MNRDEDHQRPRRMVLGTVVAIYLVGPGGLVGTLLERIRFDYHPVLARCDDLLRARQAAIMSIEREIARGSHTTNTEAASN